MRAHPLLKGGVASGTVRLPRAWGDRYAFPACLEAIVDLVEEFAGGEIEEDFTTLESFDVGKLAEKPPGLKDRVCGL